MALPLLKKGDTGFNVIRLQNALTNAGYKFSQVGTFDSVVEAALREFQAARGLVPSGQTDSTTWVALAPFDKVVLDPAKAREAETSGAVAILVGMGLLVTGVWAWKRSRAKAAPALAGTRRKRR